MKRTIAIAALVALALTSQAQRVATEAWVTNRIDGAIRPVTNSLASIAAAVAANDVQVLWASGASNVWATLDGGTNLTVWSLSAGATNRVTSLSLSPTNAITRWLVYDSGVGDWLRVTVSNREFFAQTTGYQGPAPTGFDTPYDWTNRFATWSALAVSTGGLVRASVTNGLASAALVAASTQGLATASLVSAATNGLVGAWVTNGLAGAASVALSTQGLATVALVQAATGGLVRASVTNGLVGASVTNGLLAAEYDTLASVAARGGFAGSETIAPYRITTARMGDSAGISAGGTNWLALGTYAGYAATGDDWLAVGYRAFRAASVSRSVAIGPWAGRNAMGAGRVYVGAYTNDPGEAHNALYDALVLDGPALTLYAGWTNGTIVFRGSSTITNGLAGVSITNGLASWYAVQVATQGLVSASVTNGLAGVSITNGLVGASVTNGLVGAYLTNGLASAALVQAATQGLATAAMLSAATNGLVGASVTNGLAGVSITNGLVGASVTNGLASEEYVQSQVFSAGTVTPETVTNITSYLISWQTNSTGFVTQRVERVGGSTVTNFFSRAGVTGGTYTEDGWTRPALWPIADTYASVSTWRACESGVCKLVLLADEWEGFIVDVDLGGRFAVDWNGDGVDDAVYTDNSLATNVYSTSVGQYKAVRIHTWGGTNIVNFVCTYDADSRYPPSNTVLSGAKRNGLCELILPLGMTATTASGLTTLPNLVSVVGDGMITIPSTWCYMCQSLENVRLPAATSVGANAFEQCRALRFVNVSNITSVAGSGFNGCVNLRSLTAPKLGAFGNQSFYNCGSLTETSAFPLWTSTVGSSCFQGCNLTFAALTNIAANLPSRADLQTLNMTLNPGSAAARAWYGSGEGSPSNTLVLLNWKLSL